MLISVKIPQKYFSTRYSIGSIKASLKKGLKAQLKALMEVNSRTRPKDGMRSEENQSKMVSRQVPIRSLWMH